MKTSEKSTAIIKKMFAVQKSITGVSKTASNPFFKSDYADLNTILENLFPILQENSLILNQSSIQREHFLDTFTRITDIESGEWMESSVSVPVMSDKPQDGGSTLTYSRRYGVMTFLSLRATDDDGNSGSGKTATQKVKEAFKGEDVTPTKDNNIKEQMKNLPGEVKSYLKTIEMTFDEIVEFMKEHNNDNDAMLLYVRSL